MRKLLCRSGVLCLGIAITSMVGASSVQAGNVRASISGGNLYLYGDNASNSLMLSSVESGKIFISDAGGSEATTINGGADPVELSGWTGGIFAYLYEGDDYLQIASGTVRGPVHLDLGGGNDEISIAGTATEESEVPASIALQKTLLVLGGSGNDSVYLSGLTVQGQTTLDLGNGDDLIELGDGTLDESGSNTSFQNSLVVVPGGGADTTDLWGVEVAYDVTIDDPTGASTVYLELVDVGRNLFVFTSPQSDMLTLADVNVHDLAKIISKDGIDDLLIETLSTDRLEIYLGAADDLFEASSVIANRMWLYLEGGNDLSNLLSSAVNRLYIYGAAGNDDMTLSGTTGTEAYIYGEGGTDSLVESGNTYSTFRVYSVEN